MTSKKTVRKVFLGDGEGVKGLIRDTREGAVNQENRKTGKQDRIKPVKQELVSRRGGKVTFYLDPDVPRRLKIYSANKGKNLSEAANEILSAFLTDKAISFKG